MVSLRYKKDILVVALYLPGDDQDGVCLLAQTRGHQLMNRLKMTQAKSTDAGIPDTDTSSQRLRRGGLGGY